MIGGGTPLLPSSTKSSSIPLPVRWLVRSSEELEAKDEEPNENFLVGGAGGLRRLELRGVCDLEPGAAADKLDAAEPGRSGSDPIDWPRVRDCETSFREDWRTGSREV